jgi:hypothetical protein
MPDEKEDQDLNAEEEFDKAFSEATGTSTPGDLPGKEEDKDDHQDGVDPPEPPDQDDDPPATGKDADSDDPPKEPGEDDGDLDYKELWEKERHRTRSWEGRIQAAERRAKEAEERAKALEESKSKGLGPDSGDTPEGATPASDPELDEFFQEYPELVKPFEKLVSSRGEQIARKIVAEELQKITPKLSEMEERFQKDTDRQHFDRIAAVHPDWEAEVESGKVTKWVDSQPPLLRPRFQQVMKSGSAEEAIELLNLYKQSKLKHKKSAAVSRRADALDAVPSDSGGPPPPAPNKDDFDSAWDEAVGKKG